MPEQFKNIAIDDAKELLHRGALLVDIRDKNSYFLEHIQGAIHLTNDNVSDFVLENDFDKPLLVYCYHGHSSQNAAQFLADQGFESVYSLIGGYTQWKNEQR